MRTDRWILAALVIAALPLSAAAQAPPSATSEVPMLDPWVPPSVRSKVFRTAPLTEGAQLEAQVDAKLRARFAAAAKQGGTLTREQARAAGLGAIAEQFDAIDRQGRGVVTFEDYRRFLRERRPG